MTKPYLEPEIRTMLIDGCATLTTTNTKIGAFTDANEKSDPSTQACIMNLGGATEKQNRFRIMTRSSGTNGYRDAMLLANEIYDLLNRLETTVLSTFTIYYVECPLKPQQSGRDESRNYYTSAEYVFHFSYSS